MENLEKFIEKYIGTPHSKLDCYQLVQRFYEEILGINLQDYLINHSNYKRIEDSIRNETVNNWIKINEPEQYCVITFKQHPLFVNHVGIYLGNGKFLHSSLNEGVEIQRLINPNYRGTIKGFFKHKKC